MSANNSRVTLKQLYEEIKPIIKAIARLETKMDDVCNDIKTITETNKNFVSSKAFFSWLGALSVIVGIITAILLTIR